MLHIFLNEETQNYIITCKCYDKYSELFIQYKFVSNKLMLFYKFYFMTECKKIKLQLINIQIGTTIRYARLKAKISQEKLASSIGYTSTMVGRIERFENTSGWDKIFSIAEVLNVNFCNLFILQTEKELLEIVAESYKLEEKLNQEKMDYYDFLKRTIVKNYVLLAKCKD